MTAWRKSSRSTHSGNCVTVAAVPWRKSQRSISNGECVEVSSPGVILVRDSKGQATLSPGAVLQWQRVALVPR